MSSKAGQSFRMSDGDWICEDQNCQNINFARRMNCNICGKDKPIDSRLKDKDPDKKRKMGHEIGKAAADKSKGLFSADDWQCGRCGNVNWARRSTCNMCSAPKFGENEERTGLGGGYNEREQVEYVHRSDSDDEFDDFGRRKKKMRQSKSSDDSTNESHKSSSKDKDKDRAIDDSKDSESSDHSEDDDEEDDESGDVSKYKLDSDEEEDDEEEEEEEDGEEDLSKYDLSDCLEDKK